MRSFTSLAHMAQHLATQPAHLLINLEHGLEKAAAKVEKRAKAKIGTYQDTDGAHGAWPELADSTKSDRVRKGFTENDPGLRNGAMRKSIKHKTKHLEASIGSNSDNLVWFELGTKKQPPRSVLGAALFEAMPEVLKIVGGATVSGIANGNSNTESY